MTRKMMLMFWYKILVKERGGSLFAQEEETVMMFTFYLLWLSNVSESSKDNFVVTAVSSQHCDLCIFPLLISFLPKIKLGSLRAKWTWISTETRCWIVLKPDRERIRGRLFQCSSSTETRCRIVLNPAQATKKETTCSSTGLMRRRWVALTHWGAAGRQAMSKLPAQVSSHLQATKPLPDCTPAQPP